MVRLRSRATWRWAAAGLTLLVGAGAAVAATGGLSPEDPTATAPVATSSPVPAHAAAGDERGAKGAPGGPLAGGGQDASPPLGAPVLERSLPPVVTGPRVVRTAELRVEVPRRTFPRAFREATRIAGVHGGFVATSSSESRDGRPALGALTLRVPAAAFDATRAALAELGTLRAERISGEDVGGQLVDIEARLRSLAVEEDALRALMAKATTVGETIQVQQQLTRVRQEIESLNGQKARLDDAVAFATVAVELAEPGTAPLRPEPVENPLVAGARRAAHGSLAVLGGTLVVLGYTAPLAALALLAWGVWRLVTRRHRRLAVS